MNTTIKIKLNDFTQIKRFVEITRGFMSDIKVITNRSCVSGKSILGLFNTNLSEDVFVKIVSDNADECEIFKKAMEEFRT